MLIQTRVFSIAFTILLPVLAGAQIRKSADDPDQKELYSYVLTTDKLQKLVNATLAMAEYGKAHPELNNAKSADAKNLDQMVQKLEKYPPVVAILSKNGMTPREYAVGFFTLLQASMAVGFKKSGTYKDYPPQMLKLVSKQNLDFVDQHFDEIQKATAAMQGKEKDQDR
jgi:hypothetical protein